jgi:hypothetical protein
MWPHPIYKFKSIPFVMMYKIWEAVFSMHKIDQIKTGKCMNHVGALFNLKIFINRNSDQTKTLQTDKCMTPSSMYGNHTQDINNALFQAKILQLHLIKEG